MSGDHEDIENALDMNEVGILEIMVRNAIDQQTKERPESINEPDEIDATFHKLFEKLARCYRGILYEHPASDEIGRLVRNVLAPDALFERFRREGEETRVDRLTASAARLTTPELHDLAARIAALIEDREKPPEPRA